MSMSAQGFVSYCFGNESTRNCPIYKDGTFWTMLGVAVVSAIASTMATVPWRAARFNKNAGALFDKELFFVSLPQWLMPVLYVVVYVCYFLGTYLMYRKINNNTDISAEKRNKSKSYLWLLFLTVMVAKPLWSFAYLTMGEPLVGFLFLAVIVAALLCQAVLTGSDEWGGGMHGPWYLILPFFAFGAFVALPLGFSSAFTKKGKAKFAKVKAATAGKSSGRTSGGGLSSLAP